MSSVIPTTRPMHPVAQELAASSGFLLTRLGFGFKTNGIAKAEEAGFEVYDYGVLAMLAEGVRQTQATIADALGVDPSRLVALLDSLEARGLVTRQRDPQDRRRHVVSITEAGTHALAQLRELIVEFGNEFFAPLDAPARAQFHELLTRLAMQNDPRCCPFIELDGSMPAAI